MKHKCHLVSWKLGQNVFFLWYNQYSAQGDPVTLVMSSAGLKAECVQAQRLCVKGRLSSAVASFLLWVFVQTGLPSVTSYSHMCIIGWCQKCVTINYSKVILRYG